MAEVEGGWTTYPNSLIDQLTGLLQLLRGAADGKDAYAGVSVGRRVSLQLHMGTRLLFDVLDGFSTWEMIRLKAFSQTDASLAVKSPRADDNTEKSASPSALPHSPEVAFHLLGTLACVSPLIYHSVLTSMQISKQKETSPAHLPLRGVRCQLPDVWGEQLHQRGEMKHSWQEKRDEIEAYPPSGISFVSFTLFILDLVSSAVKGGGHIALKPPPPLQCPSERK